MRALFALPLLFAACAVPPHIVETDNDTIIEATLLGPQLARADVVVLGEVHGVKSVHETHLELIQEIHKSRPNMVIAMEMFERDVQTELDKYLAGVIDEATFLENSRPWNNYERDYRPVIEFAKRNGVVVLAANAPRSLARKVAMQGVDSVAGEIHVARETSAPEDEYWDAFVDAMGEHGGMHGENAMAQFYAAQCLKDDTMAESICDYLKRHRAGGQPLAVLICGKMHSDYGRGTVQRIVQRMPALDVRVLSVEIVDDMASGLYESPRDVADYVVVTDERPPEPKMPPPRAAGSEHSAGEHEGEHAVDEVEEMDTTGMRPALGLMPDYGGNDDGVLVAMLREGGPAERGGVQVGDLIVELAGVPIDGVETYTEVLDEQKIGEPVELRVKRGDETLRLEVVVTFRTR